MKMSILQRLRNIWRLSGMYVEENTTKDGFPAINLDYKPEERKQAQIIKMNSPKDKFLKEKTNE